MTLTYRTRLLICGLLFGLLTTFNSCQNHLFESAHGTSTLGNPLHARTSFSAGQYQSITSLTVCMTQMVLMNVSGEQVTVPFTAPEEQTIPVSGLDLWDLPIPYGQYTKIDLMLADACGTGQSLALTNSSGTFNTNSQIALEFSGNEFVGATAQKIVFDIQTLASALSQAQSGSTIATIAMSSQGTYHSAACGMQTNISPVAFCETFDQPSQVTNRSGQMNGSLWMVARSGADNQGQMSYDTWGTSTIDACGSLQPAQPDGSDILVCNGQLRESTNDDGNVTTLAMSPRQAFDFNGRTGTIAFDVTNDTTGSSGVWPEIWLSDQSIPGPELFGGIQLLPRNGIGLRFNGAFQPNQGGVSPNCPNDSNNRWVIGSISLVQNYTSTDVNWFDGNAKLQPMGCVIASDGSSGKMNHIELRVSQNQIEVWATDAGSPNLIEIAVLSNLSLPFTRGYIALTDNHNSANLSHTFAWDNVAFDGPVVKRDLGFDVLDALTPFGSGMMNLGWFSTSSATPVNVSTVALAASDVQAANATGLGASLTMNFNAPFNPLTTIYYTVNGTALSSTIPFPTVTYNMYSVELPVPASALVTGAQSLSIWSNDGIIIYNIDIKLIGAGQ